MKLLYALIQVIFIGCYSAFLTGVLWVIYYDFLMAFFECYLDGDTKDIVVATCAIASIHLSLMLWVVVDRITDFLNK